MKAVLASLLAAVLSLAAVAPALAVPASACNQLYKAWSRANDAAAPGASHILETFNALGCTPR